MIIDEISSGGALPVLEQLVRFSGARQRVIANNVSNLSTPGFRPVDVSVKAFQESLGRAIDARRDEIAGGQRGTLEFEDTMEVSFTGDRLELNPVPIGENILFHDENDRDLERLMQDVAENAMTFRFATRMLRNRIDLINNAISERV
ncbi:MAG: hypothetical protein CMJ32_11655 [Phycisphaerae bacterium]|nr:hypothetical protein [Phycisphaerae bacterium]